MHSLLGEVLRKEGRVEVIRKRVKEDEEETRRGGEKWEEEVTD